MATTISVKEPVKLKQKLLKNGNKSLYLETYINGKKSYEFLQLYLIPELSVKDRATNQQTLALANAIKSERIVDVQNSRHGFVSKSKTEISFIDYLREQQSLYLERGSTMYAQSVRNSILHLINYAGENVKFKHVTKQFLIGYVKYLDTAKARGKKLLAPSSKKLYFQVIVTALNRAVKEQIIERNPAEFIMAGDRPIAKDTQREYLTFEELTRLMNSDYSFVDGKYFGIRQAFLFSCFCGLRVSDIRNLTWGDIRVEGGGNYVARITQQKTRELIDIPLSNNALAHLPTIRGKKSERIFSLPMAWVIERELDRWVKSTGIDKHITFHCARHTHATLLLTYGADIYTVSKLLGHTRVQTTEVYAKIIDDKKRQAVDLIPTINI